MTELTDLPLEVLCLVMGHLSAKKVLQLSMLSRKMNYAAFLYLKQCSELHLVDEGEALPVTITDKQLIGLLKKCPNLKYLFGLRPINLCKYCLLGLSSLSIHGILDALWHCPKLKSIETDNIFIMESLLHYMPHVKIVGHRFKVNSVLPSQALHRIDIPPNPNLSSLHLTGIELLELMEMPRVQQLCLNSIFFAKAFPFQNFSCPKMKIFSMRHCLGPPRSTSFLPLVTALGNAPDLCHLELISVPILGGLIEYAVEKYLLMGGFCNLKSLTISGCQSLEYSDLGSLLIASSDKIQCLTIGPELGRDPLFHLLFYSNVRMQTLKRLHLGCIDRIPGYSIYFTEQGVPINNKMPTELTDFGLKILGDICPELQYLCLVDCPLLLVPNPEPFAKLKDLIFIDCQSLLPAPISHFVESLPNLKTLVLTRMLDVRSMRSVPKDFFIALQNIHYILIDFRSHQLLPVIGLTMTSTTLRSITLNQCGISSIVINNCPHLTHLELKDCEHLEFVNIGNSTKISCINIISCPKLKISMLLDSVLCLPAPRLRFVYIKSRPEQVHSLRRLERDLFQHRDAKKHSLCLLQDKSPLILSQTKYRENMRSWLQISNKMVLNFLKKMEKANKPPPRLKFCEIDLHISKGRLANGSFKMSTTIPCLQYLWKNENSEINFEEMPLVDSFTSRDYNECVTKAENLMNLRYPNIHLSQIGFYIHFPPNKKL